MPREHIGGGPGRGAQHTVGAPYARDALISTFEQPVLKFIEESLKENNEERHVSLREEAVKCLLYSYPPFPHIFRCLDQERIVRLVSNLIKKRINDSQNKYQSST